MIFVKGDFVSVKDSDERLRFNGLVGVNCSESLDSDNSKFSSSDCPPFDFGFLSSGTFLRSLARRFLNQT